MNDRLNEIKEYCEVNNQRAKEIFEELERASYGFYHSLGLSKINGAYYEYEFEDYDDIDLRVTLISGVQNMGDGREERFTCDIELDVTTLEWKPI